MVLVKGCSDTAVRYDHVALWTWFTEPEHYFVHKQNSIGVDGVFPMEELTLICTIYCIIDATYSDPLGEAPARPKTAGRQRHQPQEDEFGDEELGDDLLPE